MASEVGICNRALSHLGAYRIDSLAGSTKEARECNTLFDDTRDAVLRAHDWAFARAHKTLAVIANAEYPGWTYAYSYPTECLAARRIWNETDGLPGTIYDPSTDLYRSTGKIPFEVRAAEDLDNRVILTDKEDAVLIFTAKITDPNLFDSQFIEIMAYKLAADLAIPLRADAKKRAELYQTYLTFLQGAQAESANEGYEAPTNDNSFTQARG